MRNVPAPPPGLVLPGAMKRDSRQQTYPLRLITPLFGGGHTARKIDPLNPIRGASVRGHLHFWWRLLYGANYSTPAALYAAEESLWGSAQSPGRIALRVTVPPEELKAIPGRLRAAKDKEFDQKQYPDYALLGLKAEQKFDGAEAAVELTELLFAVHLAQAPGRPPLTDDEWAQAHHAVAAWIKYGGVGARTRRGCGSIGLTEEIKLPAFSFDAQGQRHKSPLTLLERGTCLTKLPAGSAISAWSAAVAPYQKFRQLPGFARNPGSGSRPGRSYWPEPNALRARVFPQRPWKHPAPPGAALGFPRADLGLPIVFHFHPKPGEVELKEVTLQGGKPGRLRFASPVITKAVQNENGRYVPTILILDSPSAGYFKEPLELRSQTERFAPGKEKVTQADIDMTAADRTNTTTMNGKMVRDALMDFLLTIEGFKK